MGRERTGEETPDHMTTTTDSVFETNCDVSTDARTDEAVAGRVLVGRGRIVVATDDGGETIPTERVFDVTTAHVDGDGHRLTIGYESSDGRRTVSARAGAETIAKLRRAVFAAVIDGTWATLRRRDGETGEAGGESRGRNRSGRLAVDDRLLRVVGDDAVYVLEDVTGVGAAGAEERLCVSVRRDDASTTYELSLPSPRLRNVVARYLRTGCGVGGAAVGGPAGDGIRVLLVDDDVGFAELASEFLAQEDDAIELETVTDAAAGLERLQQPPPIDCVVSDYRMPRTDGLSFLQDVRRFDPELPFLLFTGRGDEEIAAEAIQAGVTDYVRKKGSAAQFAFLADRIREAVGVEER
jgi:CheY-like chemotaxis protein